MSSHVDDTDVVIVSPPLKKSSANRTGISRSNIWGKFTKVDDVVTCDICSSKFTHSATGSTTTLWNHLKKTHPHAEKEARGNEREVVEEKAVSLFSERKMSASKKKILDGELARFMVDGGIAFNVLSSSSFKKFLHSLNSAYKLPCRQTFRDVVLPAAVGEALEETRLLLANQHVSITADEWSSHRGTVCLFALTGHIVDDNFDRKNLVLAAASLEGLEHNADNYYDIIRDTMDKLNVPESKLFALSSDGAAVMLKLRRDLGLDENSVHCYSHVLHLIVVEALKEFETITAGFRKMRDFSRKLNKSEIVRSDLRRMLGAAGYARRLPASPIVTRWNSLYMMAEDMYSTKEVIDECMREHDLQPMRRVEWENIASILVPLRLFYQQTQMVCKEDSTVSEYLSLSILLRKELERLGSLQSNPCQEFCQFLVSRVETRFGPDWLRPSLRIATFLDPRFCHSGVLFDENVWREIQKEVLDMCDDLLPMAAHPKTAHPVAEPNDNSDSSSPTESRDGCSVFRLMENRDNDSSSTKESQVLDAEAEIALFVLRCQKERPKSTESPFDWWREFGSHFPTLRRLAKICLSTPATSVDSERLFSAAGLLYGNKLRNRLDGSKAGELLLLKLRPLSNMARSLRVDSRRRRQMFEQFNQLSLRYGLNKTVQYQQDMDDPVTSDDSNWEGSDSDSD